MSGSAWGPCWSPVRPSQPPGRSPSGQCRMAGRPRARWRRRCSSASTRRRSPRARRTRRWSPASSCSPGWRRWCSCRVPCLPVGSRRSRCFSWPLSPHCRSPRACRRPTRSSTTTRCARRRGPVRLGPVLRTPRLAATRRTALQGELGEAPLLEGHHPRPLRRLSLGLVGDERCRPAIGAPQVDALGLGGESGPDARRPGQRPAPLPGAIIRVGGLDSVAIGDDGTARTSADLSSGKTYRVVAYAPDPSVEDMRAADPRVPSLMRPYTLVEVPLNLNLDRRPGDRELPLRTHPGAPADRPRAGAAHSRRRPHPLLPRTRGPTRSRGGLRPERPRPTTPYFAFSSSFASATATTSSRPQGAFALPGLPVPRQDRLLPAVLEARWRCFCA